jgi:subtilisin-like proprotein convertase family protein
MYLEVFLHKDVSWSLKILNPMKMFTCSKQMLRGALSTIAFLVGVCGLLQAQQGYWQNVALSQLQSETGSTPQITARAGQHLALDFELLYEAIEMQGSSFTIELPDENGVLSHFEIVENTTMSEGLKTAFPSIMAYTIVSAQSRNTWGKMELSPNEFRAMIFRPGRSTLFIDPIFQGENTAYLAYAKKDFYTQKLAECGVQPGDKSYTPNLAKASTPYNDCELKTYRIAVSATGEYSTFHGGTVELAMAAIVTSMNRVNGVYERDFGVTMTLIPNNADIVYTNAANDPFTNGNPGAMINENQTNTDNVIGSANYDIGHVFGTNSGGLAGLGVTCNNNNKARGVTGSAAPINDPFDIDYVAHEIGHQFGGNHSFNNACGGNRNNSTAAEPGSGSTIMAYAGICPANVQSNSDDHFHGINMSEIGIQITNNNCQVNTPIDNVAPVIGSIPELVYVPASTPFILTAPASDADGDSLTWCWEQMDVEISTQPPVAESAVGPNFRSNSPIPDSSRYFPSLSALAANGPNTWERLSSVSRDMSFRVSVRDNAPGAGCTQYENSTVQVVGEAGPFRVVYPSALFIEWQAFSFQTITWDVANTTDAPINAELVDIYLSTDGGQSYPTLIAENVPNTGSLPIQTPNIATTTARIMVVNSQGTFFDVSNNNFTITAIENGFAFESDDLEATICQGEELTFEISVAAIGNFTGPIELSVSDQPENASVNLSETTTNPGEIVSISLSETGASPAGTSQITIIGEGEGFNNSISFSIAIIDANPVAAAPLSPEDGATNVPTNVELVWESNPTFGSSYTLELATDEAFNDVVEVVSELEANTYELSNLDAETTYFWRISNITECAESDPSEVFSFDTFVCQLEESADVPLAIAPGSSTSSIEITTQGVVADVNVVNLAGTHPNITDLSFRLLSPQGTAVELTSGNCGLSITLASNGDVIVLAPGDVAGTYASSGAAAFGPNIPASGITANAVLGDDGSANGSELCNAAVNASEIDGNIAIVYRGNCPFVEKVLNAQDAGAAAVIVVNNVPDGFFAMGGNSTEINIPSVMISQADGDLLVAEAGGDAADFFFSFDDQASSTTVECPATGGGVYQPGELLEVFNGENAAGIWNLEIVGAAETEPGSLSGWGLQICYTGDEVNNVSENPANDALVYPNPTSGLLTVRTGTAAYERALVYDYSGRLIRSYQISGQPMFEIDLSGYANGLYVLSLIGNVDIQTIKVIKGE